MIGQQRSFSSQLHRSRIICWPDTAVWPHHSPGSRWKPVPCQPGRCKRHFFIVRKPSRENVPPARADLSKTGMCGSIARSLTKQPNISAEPYALWPPARRSELGSRHRYNNRLHDRNRRAAGDGASRVGRSDPARTRRGSGCRSRAAKIRRRRRCGLPRAKRSRRNLQHRAIALLTAYELGAGARQQDRRFAEGLWPAVVAAQRVFYRLLAFCWTLEEAGSNGAGSVALAVFGASGQASLNAPLEGLSNALTLGRIVPISSDVPGCY